MSRYQIGNLLFKKRRKNYSFPESAVCQQQQWAMVNFRYSDVTGSDPLW